MLSLLLHELNSLNLYKTFIKIFLIVPVFENIFSKTNDNTIQFKTTSDKPFMNTKGTQFTISFVDPHL